ncbi:hypothetical protein NJB1507_04870, partial [Mycobacterium marinum]
MAPVVMGVPVAPAALVARVRPPLAWAVPAVPAVRVEPRVAVSGLRVSVVMVATPVPVVP